MLIVSVRIVGNFTLPEEGELFDQVIYTDIPKEEAEELVRKYNTEGKDSRPRDERPFNRSFGGSGRDMDRGSYGRPPMGGGGGYRSRC